MGEQLTANRPNTPVDKMTDDLQQFFRKMAEEEAEAGESADGGTAGESMDNDADMLANVADPAPRRPDSGSGRPRGRRSASQRRQWPQRWILPFPFARFAQRAAERRSAVAWQCFWSSSPWCWSWSSSP